jgi:FADH2 O2-dependent halogenase
MENAEFDVIILGAGLAGTTMGTVLAKNGHRVLIIEKGTLPQFTIGEATLPQTSYWLWMIGAYHGIPEIQYLADARAIEKFVTQSCGIKRSIGFLYHRDGKPQDAGETHQLIAPEIPFASESHYFREDIDLYMLDTARRYGITYRDRTAIDDLSFDDHGVAVQAAGEVFRARYLIDASGYRSAVAQKFDLRDSPPRARTSTRSIFTHVEGVKSYDDLIPPEDAPGLSHQWHEGTLHHVFDGGWIWVIPFNNHEGATNPLASVGLMLDTNRYPKDPSVAPEDEFRTTVARFPSVARQLEDIRAVRDWVSTDRIQYTSKASTGPRYFLMSHAHGFIDPLYSRGLINTFETIHLFSQALIAALEDDDFSPERFAYFDSMQDNQLRVTDQSVSNAYRSMADFRLWNPWTQAWMATKLFGDLWLFRTILHFVNSGDRTVLTRLKEEPSAGAAAPYAADLQRLVDAHTRALDSLEAGEIDVDGASSRMFSALNAVEWLPRNVYAWGDPSARHVDFTPDLMMKLIGWGKTAAPDTIRTGAFDFEMPPAMG